MARTRVAAIAAAVVVVMSGLVVGSAGGASAECGSLCTPQGLMVVGDLADLEAGGTGTAISSAALGEASTVAGTAGTASGVAGVNIGGPLGATLGALGGAAMYVGVKGLKAGSVSVDPGQVSGLAAPGSAPGFSPVSTLTVASPAERYDFSTVTTSAHYLSTTVASLSIATKRTYLGTGTSGSGGLVVYVRSVCGSISGGTTPTYVSTAAQASGMGSVALPSGGSQTGTASFSPQTCSQIASGSKLLFWTVEYLGGISTNSVAAVNTAVGSGKAIEVFPSDSPDYPAGSTPGAGVITQSLTCVGAGGTSTTLTQQVPVSLAGGDFAFPAMTCPPGMVSGQFGATFTAPGTGTTTVVPTTPTDPGIQSIPAEYPNCTDAPCLLRLFKVAPDGTLSGCGDLAMACPDWYTDPNRVDDYECQWGTYVVSTDRCSVYRVPGQVLPNAQVGTDGSLQYQAWPPLPSPAPAGDPAPSSGECYPNGWSAFNPVEWVYMPIKCALTWAFVPTETQVQVKDIADELSTKAPAAQIASIAAWLQPPADTSSSCLDWSLTVWVGQSVTVPVLNSCDPDDVMVKAISPHRTLFAVAVWIAFLAPLAWWAWKEYAPGSKGTA